jgi:opacity protein-like surface antigen
MNKTIFATVAVSLSGLGAASAQTYVYPTPAPPPPAYVYPAPGYPAPPPPAYPTAPAPSYFYVLPPDAGPFANFDAGLTIYQNGALKSFGGPASGSVHYDVGGSGDATIGYAFNRYVAVGFEIGVNTTTIDSIPGYVLSDAQLYNVPFLANITFTYPIPHSLVTPYIGCGVGGSDSVFDPNYMADVNFRNTVGGEEDDVVFAWEAYAGLRFQLTPNMSLGIGYKYFGTGNPNFSYPSFPAGPNFNVGFQGVETHSILASFNMRF